MKLKIWNATEEKEETLTLRLVREGGIIDLVTVDEYGATDKYLIGFRSSGTAIRYREIGKLGLATCDRGRIKFEDEAAGYQEDTS